jgi:L-asparagine oxygenase
MTVPTKPGLPGISPPPTGPWGTAAPAGSPFAFVLTAVERHELATLAEELVITGPGLVDDPAWLEHARRLGCRLPLRIREVLRRFRHDPGPQGTLVFGGLPVDPTSLPATPRVAESAQRTATAPAAIIVLIAAQLGEVVAYRDEKAGALVQDVLAVPGLEQSQSNAGSVPLHMHVENAFHDARPDYVGLLCLRSDQARHATTLVASIRRVAGGLSAADRRVLGQPRFATAPPPSFVRGDAAAAHPVLLGCPDDPDVRLDLNATRALDCDAGHALERLRAALASAAVRLVLRSGDMALLDNRVVLHGRSRFSPRYDGLDRWLHRVYVQLDNRRSRPFRAGAGAVLN